MEGDALASPAQRPSTISDEPGTFRKRVGARVPSHTVGTCPAVCSGAFSGACVGGIWTASSGNLDAEVQRCRCAVETSMG